MLELAGVSFAHARGPTVLDGAELAVAAGEVVIVGAPAGAGMSTIAALIAGRLTGRGLMVVAGRDVTRLRASSRAALRRCLGVVPQELALVDDRTGLGNVALALEVLGVPRGERLARAAAALAAADAPAEIAVAALPMAARQRVAWARAFVRNPDIVVADQPTSHQDADGAERFAGLCAERAAAGAACLVLAREPHLVAAAARRGWRALALHQHRFVDVAEMIPEEVAADPHVMAEIDCIPNLVPFPLARSAGHRA